MRVCCVFGASDCSPQGLSVKHWLPIIGSLNAGNTGVTEIGEDSYL